VSLAQSDNLSLSWRFHVPMCSLLFNQVPNFKIMFKAFYRKRLNEILFNSQSIEVFMHTIKIFNRLLADNFGKTVHFIFYDKVGISQHIP
jgi:hypothetical protein